MMNNSWDPLVSSKEADSEIVSAAQKREIKNILKSYVGMYDSFSELIQNSLDAVDKRKTVLNEDNYKKKIWIEVDLSENSFSITDNGIGFNEKELESFLAPNISFKEGEETRGNKGVGATYIGYGFNYLQFGTKGNGHSFVGELKNGRNWVDDYKGTVTRPVVTKSVSNNNSFHLIKRGSTFKIIFSGKNIRPKDLSWYSAKTSNQWIYLLLIKTPLGCITYAEPKENDVFFDLKVIAKDGTESILENQMAKYIYPHTKIKASLDLKTILAFQKKAISKNKDASIIPNRFKKLNGLYEFFSTEEVLELKIKGEMFNEMIKNYHIKVYGYFTYSTSVWDSLNDSVASLRKGYRVLKGGLQMANNQMIQGELIVIPLTSNIGHQNQCHVIVHFKDAEPDLGRKGFQPELKNIAEKISIGIVNRFKQWKHLLKSDTGAKPDIIREIALHEWVKQQEEHESKNPLVINNKNFFAPINEISITSIPQSEQDVIVLFNQLIAGGVIRGIKLLATSQIKQYDGVFKYVVKEPLKNHEFHKTDNPLGVEEMHFSSGVTSPPKILEYKFNLNALMSEFENGYKNEKEIHLAIAWELGDEWKKNYEVTSFLDLENLHQRDFHGITHQLNSGNTKFNVIILKELIEYLNDVKGVQDYHKKEYSESIF